MLSSLWLAAAAALAEPATAPPGGSSDEVHGIYFNRPGATLTELDADDRGCATLAAKTVASPRAAGGGLMGALVSGMAAGIRRGQEQQRNHETCMVVRGWRAVYLDQAEADRLKADVGRDRVAALTPLVGAADVGVGRIGRIWASDYAEPHTAAGIAQ